MESRASLISEIVVVGGGVIGLTTARALLLKGHRVTVIAKHLPGDTDLFYASNWAGAMWSGNSEQKDEEKKDEERRFLTSTYRQLVHISRSRPEAGVTIVSVKEQFQENPTLHDPSRLWFSTVAHNFRFLEPTSYEGDDATVCTYDIPVIEPPIYLQWLRCEILALGGKIERRELSSLEEVFTKQPLTSIIVNASGLGSRTLGRVEDTKSHPIRGQNVLIRSGQTGTLFYRTAGTQQTHIIPRPRQGVLVCGGVFEVGKSDPRVDSATVSDEIRRVNLLAPQVISKTPDVAANLVGIRPGREGGYRLEHERQHARSGDLKHIIHAYGHGHNGYSVSLGTADAIVRSVDDIEWEEATTIYHVKTP
ncbi:nucleotide-binding domain-containing protein [Polychaeton citri CBS 116435]|uniref:Nucleotide-binding domain-containing protein n=1 Tax=Polychaeton citri CBS 116435 TaxID=1314669 RepID=A0A9P4Q0I8_9PEZI|nr:nucleotide-binding domain-containing protein [Polychaeton citri CBS 116435]